MERRLTRTAALLPIVAVASLLSGCLVDVDTVDDPGPAFARARAEAARVHGRPGPAERLNVLVYDRGEGRLVRLGLPLSMVEGLASDGDLDLDLGEDAERLCRKVRPHVRLHDLRRVPLGVLAEIEEEGGDQVLVWLQ